MRGPPEPSIEVLVGLIEDEHGRILVNRRRSGTHMAGCWEFPGGKRQPREDRLDALRRELLEELAIEVRVAAPFMQLSHDYPDRKVMLDIWLVHEYEGIPSPVEGQPLRWVTIAELAGIELLEADRPIVDALRRRSASRLNSATT